MIKRKATIMNGNNVSFSKILKQLQVLIKEKNSPQYANTKYVATHNIQTCMEFKVSYESDEKFLSLKDFLVSKYFGDSQDRDPQTKKVDAERQQMKLKLRKAWK